MIPSERVIQQPDTLSPAAAPATIPDEKEATAGAQDSHTSMIYPDPIPHIAPAPAAATPALTDEAITPTLTEEQEYQREEIEGIIWANTSSKAPAQAQEIEDRIKKMNQPGGGFKEPFTPQQLQHILTEERVKAAAKLEKQILKTGTHPALQTKIDRQCMEYHLTDAGNGERFAARWGEIIRYCHPRRLWYQWDGTRWVEDPGRAVYGRAKETARAIYQEGLLVVQDDTKSLALRKWAIQSEGKKRLEDMLFMATSEAAIGIGPDELDADGNLFNLTNGTIELDTLKFREHRKDDLLTKMAGTHYDPAATCPLWDAHLRRMFGGKEDLIQAIQEHIGYCMLSGNPLHIFEIWYGEAGFNGKSATIKTLNRIFGTYATSTDATTFMLSKREGNAPKPELLALRGARLVTSPESEKGAILAAGMVKQMTGGDEISTRGLFKDTERFYPEFTPILATNNAPRIQDTNNAIWNRIKRWPFTVTIPEDQRIPDFDIRLSEEAPGILIWMLEGLRRYYAAGCRLAEPPELLESTQKYRADQDIVLRFIDARCTLGPKEYVAQSLLFIEFEKWCDETGEFAVSKKDFFKSFKDRKYRFYSPGNMRSIQGIRIKSSPEMEEWEFKTQNES